MSSSDHKPTTTVQWMLIVAITIVGLLFLVSLSVRFGGNQNQADTATTSVEEKRGACLEAGNIWNVSAQTCAES